MLTGLRKIRENMPQKDNLASVFKERRDLVRNLFHADVHLITVMSLAGVLRLSVSLRL